jgi:tetratricopeptide (TPR) repeat protein
MIARIWEAQVLVTERRYREADSVAAETMALDSTFMLAWSWRAQALLGLGKSAQAIALVEREIALSPEGSSAQLAYAYAVAGRLKEARAVVDELRRRSGGRIPPTGTMAAALEELGEHEAAVAMLGAAIAAHDVWVVQFPMSEYFEKLRRDPRAATMLDRLRTM